MKNVINYIKKLSKMNKMPKFIALKRSIIIMQYRHKIFCICEFDNSF